MNLKKIIREEIDDIQWIHDIGGVKDIKELTPGQKYRIIEVKGKTKEDLEEAFDETKESYTEMVFIIDHVESFNSDIEDGYFTDFAVEDTVQVWVKPINEYYNFLSEWVSTEHFKVFPLN